MATGKKASRATRDRVAAAVAQLEAYLAQHPGMPAAHAAEAIKSDVSPSTMLKHWRRRRSVKRGATDIPLDAIPERIKKPKAANGDASPYALAKKRKTSELQTALDLFRMALKIIERQLGE